MHPRRRAYGSVQLVAKKEKCFLIFCFDFSQHLWFFFASWWQGCRIDVWERGREPLQMFLGIRPTETSWHSLSGSLKQTRWTHGENFMEKFEFQNLAWQRLGSVAIYCFFLGNVQRSICAKLNFIFPQCWVGSGVLTKIGESNIR